MKILRTPDERFQSVVDYPFSPKYFGLTPTLRMHYVDEGPRDAPVVLLLHGEPTWSYLYRHVIRALADAGLRAVAPDLIGFGKSDKPFAKSDYSYSAQVEWLRQWMVALDLKDITLVCQDWGSLLGLRLAAENQDRFARIIVGNGGLPDGNHKISKAFLLWRAFSRLSPWFPIARIVQGGTKRRLSHAERYAYDAPFPDEDYKAGARIYPSLVPVSHNIPDCEKNLAAWKVFEQWQKPFICCYSDGDPITRGLDKLFIKRIPGTRGQRHVTLRGGHFMQEDDPKGLTQLVLDNVPRA